MEIIGKTNTGVIISASDYEVREILRAVTGNAPEKLEIGQKLPAIDYASTITKIKSLSKHQSYEYLKNRVREFNDYFDKLIATIDSAGGIEV